MTCKWLNPMGDNFEPVNIYKVMGDCTANATYLDVYLEK